MTLASKRSRRLNGRPVPSAPAWLGVRECHSRRNTGYRSAAVTTSSGSSVPKNRRPPRTCSRKARRMAPRSSTGSSVRRTASAHRPRMRVADPAARALWTQSASGKAATMSRVSPTVAMETGVRRGSPVRRPGTVSKACDPIRSPRRSIPTLSRTIQPGGGLTLFIAPRSTFSNVTCADRAPPTAARPPLPRASSAGHRRRAIREPRTAPRSTSWSSQSSRPGLRRWPRCAIGLRSHISACPST